MIKYKYSKLYWFFKQFEWMKVYFSPFKFFLPKLYVGKVVIGTPHFYPRKWKKATPQKAILEATKEVNRIRQHNAKEGSFKLREATFEELYERYKNSSFSYPKKIGFDFCGLGWKTKFDSYRHESNPVWSFVFFGYQIALMFRPKHDVHFWECYLNYFYETDKSKSPRERIKQAREKYSCRWKTYKDDKEEKICYWDVILKEKYK